MIANDDEEDEEDEEVEIIAPPSKKLVKPVMSADVESDVLNTLSQFQNRDAWKKWGMHKLREQGPAVLFTGPPGVGKTMIARWMAKRVRKGWKVLDVAALSGGGGEPGAMEASVRKFFADARARGNMTVAIDECDHILGDRTRIAGDALTWMLGTTETLMTEMNRYPGLVLCMTNHEQILDSALSDRFMAIIQVDIPDFDMRIKLWRMKIPESFPFQPNDKQLKILAKTPLTGRQIENVIVNVASYCIRLGHKPTVEVFKTFTEKEKGKHLG